MKKAGLLALCLAFLSTAALAYQSTVNPVVPVQNSPLQSSVVRNNFAATAFDINNIYSLLPNPVGSIITSGSVTPGDCVVWVSANIVQDVGPCPGGAAVSSVSGTAGQITASPTTGAVVLSLPATLTPNLTLSGTVNFTNTFSISGVAQTFPTSGLLVGTTDTQTLTNKSIAGSEINSGTVGASFLPTATSAAKGIVQGDGSTLTISGGTISCTTGTTSQNGCLTPDGTTITVSAGVISAVTGGGGNVSGPASSTLNAIATYADTTGKLIKDNTGVVISSNAIVDTQSISATSTDGLSLQNTTSATVGAQKWSPRLRWTGDGWKTTSTAAGQLVDAIAELQPVQGSTNPSFNWVLSGQINAGGYAALVTVPSGGGFNLNSGTYQIGGTQIACSNLSNGATSCSTDTTNASNISSGTLAAARGGAGSITGALKGNGAGVVTQAACADLSNGATGCSTATGTSGATIPLLNGTNTWSGAQSFNSSDLLLKGATSGTITLNAAATAGSNTLTLPAGTTDFSGTGGASQVVKQTASGGAFTVARLACADLSNSSASCSTDATVATNITSGTLPTAQLPANQIIRGIEFVIDGGGSTITTGVKGFVLVPFACTITKATLLGDQSGSIVVDVWAKAFAASLPTVANTITASALPTISSNVTVQDSTLTGWTTAIAANSMVGFNVNSVTTMQRVTVILTCNAT